MQTSGDGDSLPSHLSPSCQELIDGLPFYVLVVDDEHRIGLANKAVTQALGVDPSAIIGRFCPKVVHGTDGPFPGCPLEEAVARGNITVERELFDSAQGRWLNSCVYPIGRHPSTGRYLFLTSSRTSMSARRRVRESAMPLARWCARWAQQLSPWIPTRPGIKTAWRDSPAQLPRGWA